jgi:hypothetical protein
MKNLYIEEKNNAPGSLNVLAPSIELLLLLRNDMERQVLTSLMLNSYLR